MPSSATRQCSRVLRDDVVRVRPGADHVAQRPALVGAGGGLEDGVERLGVPVHVGEDRDDHAEYRPRRRRLLPICAFCSRPARAGATSARSCPSPAPTSAPAMTCCSRRRIRRGRMIERAGFAFHGVGEPHGRSAAWAPVFSGDGPGAPFVIRELFVGLDARAALPGMVAAGRGLASGPDRARDDGVRLGGRRGAVRPAADRRRAAPERLDRRRRGAGRRSPRRRSTSSARTRCAATVRCSPARRARSTTATRTCSASASRAPASASTRR